MGRRAACSPDEKIKLVSDDKIRRVVLCTGKVYYDLYEEREKRGIDDIYLLRLEQLYPFPTKALVAELTRFKQAEIVWCQEEPRNMGAWSFVDVFLDLGAEPDRCQAQARALCRTPGCRLDRGRADVEAFGATEAVPGRRIGMMMAVVLRRRRTQHSRLAPKCWIVRLRGR